MGLDISAYRKLRYEPNPKFDDDGNLDDWRSQIVFKSEHLTDQERDFPGRAVDLLPMIFGGSQAREMQHLILVEKPIVCTYQESYGWRAGSYSGYSTWRDWLAKFGGWTSAKDCWESDRTSGPFYELICFSDCEGILGQVVCEKLLKDFRAYNQMAIAEIAANSSNIEYYAGLYAEWIKGLEMAADGGCLAFH